MTHPILIHDLRFSYPDGAFSLRVPELRVEAGERLGLRGPSGSGKSTLLELIAGIRGGGSGRLTVAGHDLVGMSEAARRAHRLASIGFIEQDYPLIDALDLRGNVLLPLRLVRWRLAAGARDRADGLLGGLGLAGRGHERPDRLSMGERQRVAIARALISDPPILLADEPTSGLDPERAATTVDLLLHAGAGRCVVIASHDPAVLQRLDRVIDVSAWGAK